MDGTVKPVIDTYAETAVKPELQSFADELKEAFDTNATEKTAAVNALAEQASASASSAASSSSAAQTAAGSGKFRKRSAEVCRQCRGGSNAADYASQAEDSAGAAKTSGNKCRKFGNGGVRFGRRPHLRQLRLRNRRKRRPRRQRRLRDRRQVRKLSRLLRNRPRLSQMKSGGGLRIGLAAAESATAAASARRTRPKHSRSAV